MASYKEIPRKAFVHGALLQDLLSSSDLGVKWHIDLYTLTGFTFPFDPLNGMDFTHTLVLF